MLGNRVRQIKPKNKKFSVQTHPTDDFPKLLSKLEGLIDIPSKVEITTENSWKNHAQLMVIKAYYHLRSIATLVGYESDKKLPIAHIDHGSVAVLARAAYETYVLFNFIFLEKNVELRQFRHQVWRMSGLMSRMKLNRPSKLPPDLQKQVADESAEVSRLKPIIESSRFFKELSTRAQDNVRKGDGERLGQALIDLAEQAGLPRKYVADMYRHFCNYSHASAISIFQLRETLNDSTSQIMARSMLAFSCILLVHLILAYTELFDQIDSAVAADNELTELLGVWKRMGELFANMYGEMHTA